MKLIQRYMCEICGTEFDSEKEASTCEAVGFPDPVPWLPLDAGLYPVFGEGGVETVEAITGLFVARRFFTHEWRLYVKNYVHLSHNRDPEDFSLPVDAFDPRAGWDAFRYHCTPDDLAAWRAAMVRYGFAEETARPSTRLAMCRVQAELDPQHPRVIRNTHFRRFIAPGSRPSAPVWTEDPAQAQVFTTNVETDAMAFGARVIPVAVLDMETAIHDYLGYGGQP